MVVLASLGNRAPQVTAATRQSLVDDDWRQELRDVITSGDELLQQLGWSLPPSALQRFMITWLQWVIPAILVAVLGATIYDAAFSAH